MAVDQGSCADLQNPSKANFALSLFILVGILVSYLPQHIRLVARRSSEGISPYFVLLGTTSGTCAFANVVTIPASRHALSCCNELNGFECTAGLLGILQIGVQWACFAVILFLFILFFPRATPLAPPANPNSQTQPSYRTAILVFSICIVHAFLVLFVSTLLSHFTDPNPLTSWAYFLGILGTVLAAIQFLPQIWTTWRLGAVRSLSIPMMCIQTPGSFVWVGSLAARLGWQGWSTWGIYLVTGILQGCLLVMGISFEIRDRRLLNKKKESKADGIAGRGTNGHGRSRRNPREEGDGEGQREAGAEEELEDGDHMIDEHTRLTGNER